jgi:hypothetical protein
MRRTVVSVIAATVAAVVLAPGVSSSSGHPTKAPLAKAPAVAHEGQCPFSSGAEL